MRKVSQEVSIPTLKGLKINCISQLSLNYKCLLKRYRSQHESFLEAQLQILILSNIIYTFRKTSTPQNHVLDRFCRVQSQTCTHSCTYSNATEVNGTCAVGVCRTIAKGISYEPQSSGMSN